MVLIIGGSYQGKLEYAKKIFGVGNCIVDGKEIDNNCDDLKNMKIIYNFHLWIKKQMYIGIDVLKEVKIIVEKNPEIIVIMDEIGCGVVPMDKMDREYRETVGRIGCYLAQSAVEVHRVICGIGTVIK